MRAFELNKIVSALSWSTSQYFNLWLVISKKMEKVMEGLTNN